MQIEKEFTVSAPVDAAWRFLTDPYKVAGCLPGAAVTAKQDESTYAGTITVKVGPVATTYTGTIHFDKLDAASHTAEISAKGQDVRGKGGADLKMVSTLTAKSAGETEIRVTQEINVMGILAQMGRGMIQDVGDQLFERFTAAMRSQLETAAAPGGDASHGTATAAPASGEAPIQALTLGPAVAARALGRAARRPAFWIALLVALFLLWLLIK